MKRYIKMVAALLALMASFTACENGDQAFDDYEGGTTAYFAYQSPVRTIVLGDDEYDTTLDKAHKLKILATFGGSYNGRNATVNVAVDNSLCDNLTFADGTPVKAMPKEYYQLSTTAFNFNGGMQGGTEVQLTDDFFKDPDAVKNTYVIPLVMQNQTGFDRIATGTLKEGKTGSRTNASIWETAPRDYVMYCVKYQNKYSGWWLTNHNTSTDNIEKASQVQITTRTLNSSVYTVEFQEGSKILKADLLLTFDDKENCTITSLTEGVTATGSGSWADNGIHSWNNKDRDLMELNAEITFAGGVKKNLNEKLVWWRSGVSKEEFSYTYNN
ncbi:DUF5627 domain-containing protein [Segatella copri]|uniref:DUF5627 domain-containing protein n=1 Tax=Segatella copri TaxID=165179 RepID=UPI002FEE6813